MFGAFVKTRACHSLNHLQTPRLLLFLVGYTQGTRRPGRSNKARQHHDGQEVRHHLNELPRNVVARRQLNPALPLNRTSIRKATQDTLEQRLRGPPLPKDQSSERDETT